MIHSTAIVHSSSRIHPSAEIGPYAVIGEDVEIGPGVTVGSHAVIEFARIGERCHIFAGAHVGTMPQDLKYRGERTLLFLGPRCVVREGVTLNRGTAAIGKTVIGSDCLFMTNSHVAHDCVIGSHVIIANCTAVAGHCEIGDNVLLGGLAGIHQFVRIGKGAMVAAGAMVPQDIPPYCLAWGDRARLQGLNLIGMKRRGATSADISALKRAYRILFFSKLSLPEAIDRLEADAPTAHIEEIIEFLRNTPRGVCRPEPDAEEVVEQ